MGATGTPTLQGSGRSKLSYLGRDHQVLVPFTFTMSASYSTGGDTLTLPSSDVRAMELQEVVLLTPFDGTRWYAWDGSRSAPKIKALTAFATEAAAAANLSAVVIRGFCLFSA